MATVTRLEIWFETRILCADANYQSLRYIALEDTEDMQLAGSSLLRSARASDEANQAELEVQNMLFLSYSKF